MSFEAACISRVHPNIIDCNGNGGINVSVAFKNVGPVTLNKSITRTLEHLSQQMKKLLTCHN